MVSGSHQARLVGPEAIAAFHNALDALSDIKKRHSSIIGGDDGFAPEEDDPQPLKPDGSFFRGHRSLGHHSDSVDAMVTKVGMLEIHALLFGVMVW